MNVTENGEMWYECNRKGDKKGETKMDVDINTKGIIGELVVAAQLLKRGFAVYKNMNDIDGIDYVIRKKDILKTVQVKFANTNDNNRYSFRLSNTNIADFIVCVAGKDYYIVPKNEVTSTSIFIYPAGRGSKYNRYKNRWDFPITIEKNSFI